MISIPGFEALFPNDTDTFSQELRFVSEFDAAFNFVLGDKLVFLLKAVDGPHRTPTET